MLKKIDPEKTDAWKKLQKHYDIIQHASILVLFTKPQLGKASYR